jgi:hypothetical protein
MSKWLMQGHFRYLRFKNFPMIPRTSQYEVFWALLLNPKHSGVPKDSKSPTLGVLGFTPTLGQSGVATIIHQPYIKKFFFPKTLLNAQPKKLKVAIIIQIKLFKITTYSHFTFIFKCNHKY